MAMLSCELVFRCSLQSAVCGFQGINSDDYHKYDNEVLKMFKIGILVMNINHDDNSQPNITMLSILIDNVCVVRHHHHFYHYHHHHHHFPDQSNCL